jgi:hypothetical protein
MNTTGWEIKKLNIGTKNSKGMAVFTAGYWWCTPRASRHARQYRRVLLLYISVELIRVYFTETLPSFPSWYFMEGSLPRK